MNKNKKITLLTVFGLCALFATGCGSSPEKIEDEIDTFVEGHNIMGAALLMDTMLIAVEQAGEEKGIDVDIDEDDFVYKKEAQDVMDTLKDLKSKPLKKINKSAFLFYKEVGDLLEEARKGKISTDKFGEKVDKLRNEYEEELGDSKLFEEYNKLREKAGMDEFEEYDSSEQTQKWYEVFEEKYEDECKKIMTNILKGSLKAAASELAEDFDISDNSYGGITMEGKDEENEDGWKLSGDEENEDGWKLSGDEEDDEESSSNSEKSGGASYEFIKELAEGKEELKNITNDYDSGSAMLTVEGSKDGSLMIYASEDKGDVDYITLDMYPDGDAKELAKRLESSINAFCKEVGVEEKVVLKNIKSLYKELTSEEFLDSEEAKEDIKEFDLVSKEESVDGVKIEVAILNPEETQDRISINLMCM